MDSKPLPLCAYCSERPSRSTDPYCCDGCLILAETKLRPQEATATAHDSAAEKALIQSFGQNKGLATRFECHVNPLACEACLQSLARLEQVVPGLRDLQWNRASSTLSFEFMKGHEQPSTAFAFLNRMGLSPRWKTEGDPALNQGRARTLRLGLSAALAANIMLFSVPIYAGLAGSMQNVFEIVQMVLFLPVLTWSAQPIYRTAWASIKLRQMSVDLPLTIAFLAGSFFSISQVFTGKHDIYFDSLAGFLFLILWSRFLLERSLAKYLEAPRLEQFFERPIFSIQRNGQPQSVSWKEVQIDDELLLTASDRIPVDGILLSPAVEIETAWMTGERLPHWRLQGSTIFAGSRLLSKEAQLRVIQPSVKTEFARLLSQLSQENEKIRPSSEAQLGTGLVLACFFAILLLFTFGSSLGFDEVARRSVALLIVACPCAVSFAAPLARAKANQVALAHGFWVRDSLVWPRMTSIRKMAFDKTGTLTGGSFTLAPHSPMIDVHWKRIILSLENVSRHPIAESLRRVWGPQKLFEVKNSREIRGGVAGEIAGLSYELKGSADAAGRLCIELFRGPERVVDLMMIDEASANTASELKRLHQKYELSIVSGDHISRVQEFGQRHGFSPSHLHGGLTPNQKAKILEKIQPDLFFGDGTNDLPAMKAAPVSIAVSAAAIEAQAASDILMLDADLGRIEGLLQIARETQKLNRRNLLLALVYNVSAGTAALAGLVNPLTAALLMPVASLTLLASTLRGTSRLRALARVAA